MACRTVHLQKTQLQACHCTVEHARVLGHREHRKSHSGPEMRGNVRQGQTTAGHGDFRCSATVSCCIDCAVTAGSSYNKRSPCVIARAHMPVPGAVHHCVLWRAPFNHGPCVNMYAKMLMACYISYDRPLLSAAWRFTLHSALRKYTVHGTL
jgi:hypothetical protein